MARNRKASLKDVAELAGVSVSCVSMILSGRAGVSFSGETVKKVRAAAEQLDYHRPAENGMFDRPTIAVFITIVTGSYYTFISQAVTQKANEMGYDTLILETHHSRERELRLMHMVRRGGFAGIVFAVTPINRDYMRELAEIIPTVVIQSPPGLTGVDAVINDNNRVGRLAAEHMLSLGHRHVAYIGIDRSWQSMKDSACFLGTKEAFDRVPDAVLSVYSAPGPDALVPGSFHETRTLAAKLALEAVKDPLITGFICITDYTAYGVMDTLSGLGKRVPEDYSVCGCNNLFSSSLAGVSLTTVDRHPVELGFAAFDLLMKKLNGGETASPVSVTHIEYLSRLVVRSTTAAPRT